MKVTKVKPVVAIPRLKPITKQTKLTYKSDIDPAVIIHSNMTHRTASEAFKDAEYACSITRFKNDWQLAIDYLGGAILGFLTVATWCALPILLVVWLTK